MCLYKCIITTQCELQNYSYFYTCLAYKLIIYTNEICFIEKRKQLGLSAVCDCGVS